MYTLNAKRAMEILYEVFPGHSGIELKTKRELEQELDFTCFIHFPSLTIWNEKNHTLDIRDLYIRFTINSGRIISDFDGTRTSLDEHEVGQYNHSHISQTGFGIWGRFCTGQSFVRKCLETPLVDEDSFYAFILSIPNFVNHESLEGRPYKNLMNVVERAKQGGEIRWHANPFNDGISCRSEGGNVLSQNSDRNYRWAYSLTKEELVPLISLIVRGMPSTVDIIEIFNQLIYALYNNNLTKKLTFDCEDLVMLTYVKESAKEKSTLDVIHQVSNVFFYKTDGKLILLKERNKDSEGLKDNETIENPCVFNFPKINEDLTITSVKIPAIKYKLLREKYKKGTAQSVDIKPSLHNVGVAAFKLSALTKTKETLESDRLVNQENYANRKDFLETFL